MREQNDKCLDTLFNAAARSHSSVARRPRFTPRQRDASPPRGYTRGSSRMVGSPEWRERCVPCRVDRRLSTCGNGSVRTLGCVSLFNGSVAPPTPTPLTLVDFSGLGGGAPNSSWCSWGTVSVVLMARSSGRTATSCSSLEPGREPAPLMCSPGCWPCVSVEGVETSCACLMSKLTGSANCKQRHAR